MVVRKKIPDWKGQVSEILKQHPEGLSIGDFAELLGTSRHTVSLALAELKGQKKLAIREVGSAKLHYWYDGSETQQTLRRNKGDHE